MYSDVKGSMLQIIQALVLLDDGIRFLEVELLEEERDSLGAWRRLALHTRTQARITMTKHIYVTVPLRSS